MRCRDHQDAVKAVKSAEPEVIHGEVGVEVLVADLEGQLRDLVGATRPAERR